MNIIYMEDTGSALYKIRELEEYEGHIIYNSDRFEDLKYWMEVKPGASKIGAIIVDLIFEDPPKKEDVECLNLTTPYNRKEHPSLGLHVIKYYLLKKFPHFEKRIILCSAYLEHFGKMPEYKADMKKLQTIDKNSPSLNSDLIHMLKRIETKYGH